VVFSRELASCTEAGSKLAGRVKAIHAPEPRSGIIPGICLLSFMLT